MAITRTKEITLADAWGNDDGEVSVEVAEQVVSLTVVEAAEFAVHVMDAAWEAAVTNAEKDGEIAVQQMRERLAGSRSAIDDLVPAEGGRRQRYPSE